MLLRISANVLEQIEEVQHLNTCLLHLLDKTLVFRTRLVDVENIVTEHRFTVPRNHPPMFPTGLMHKHFL